MNKISQDLLLLKAFRPQALLITCTLLLTLLVWLPHYLRLNPFFSLDFSKGFETIYQNYDGLEYITIAKSWYDPDIVATMPQTLPASYFPSHFPGYSIFIAVFAPVMGYLKSMLFVSQLFTIMSVLMFYRLIKDFKLSSHPLILATLFLILPSRWLIVHSVGSAEPTFIFFTLAAIYAFLKFELHREYRWILLTGIFGSLAQLTRPPGILLFLALVIYLKIKFWQTQRNYSLSQIFQLKLIYLPLYLIPLTLASIFYLFQIQLQDFWAYFHTGDNIHLTLPPFAVFNKSQFWVGDIWLEDIIYILILGYLAVVYLLKSNFTKPLGYMALIYMLAGTFIAHRDISRYLLPTFPLILIAFEKVLVSKEFRIVIAIVALAIYLYSQNFILENTAPIANLADFD